MGTGGAAIRYEADGSIRSMRQLSDMAIRRIENGTAFSDDGGRRLAENVQVYLRQNGAYYLTELSAINPYDYRLTGWYDNFSGRAGGQIRILIAAAR